MLHDITGYLNKNSSLLVPMSFWVFAGDIRNVRQLKPSLWYVLGSTAHRRSWANPWKTIRLLGASLHLPGSLTAVHIIKSRQQASTLVYGPHIILLIFVISLSLHIYIHIRSVNLEMCLCNYDMNIHIYVYNYITYHISYIIDHTSVCGSIFISVISMLLAA